MSSTNWVTGLFFDVAKSESAVASFERRGVPRTDISVLMTDATKAQHFHHKPAADAATDTAHDASKVAEGAGVGGTLGGVLGATIAAIAAIGTVIAFPGLGLIVAGPLAAAFAGAGAGAATGGFIGALVGLGFSEERAKYYQAGLEKGGVLVGVHAKDEVEVGQFSSIMREFGAEDIKTS